MFTQLVAISITGQSYHLTFGSLSTVPQLELLDCFSKKVMVRRTQFICSFIWSITLTMNISSGNKSHDIYVALENDGD